MAGILNREYDKGNIHRLRSNLREIPQDLHTLFHDILTRDPHGREELYSCLQWVLFAKQSLRLEEIYFAILLNLTPGFIPSWEDDEITTTDMERFILDSSKGLAEFTKSRKPTVQFIHESVKAFLEKRDGLRVVWPDHSTAGTHERLKKSCLDAIKAGIAYLHANTPGFGQLDDLSGPLGRDQIRNRQALTRKLPFLHYAVHHIFFHADVAEQAGIGQDTWLQGFPLADWLRLYNILQDQKELRYTSDTSLLYLLAERDLANLIRCHPSKLDCFRLEHGRYGTPYFAALSVSDGRSARAFLEAYMAAQLEVHPPKSPLHMLYKPYLNDDEIRHKSFNNKDFIFPPETSVLQYLANRAPEPVTAVYLNIEQFDANAKDGVGRTPMIYAIQRGHEAITKILLGHGASVSLRDSYGLTPLIWASKSGYPAIMRILIESGADVNEADDDGFTPIFYATRQGDESGVRLLLEKGADPDAGPRLRFPTSALRQAVDQNYMAIAKLLLGGGARPGGRNKSEHAALGNAVIGNKDMLELLSKSGANFDIQDEESHDTDDEEESLEIPQP